ncbi:MAG: hypothetical protein K6C12_02840 [Oscillospiraceae bacterium]|nr:hypothetical protein [Oscillospiraceae bacterium]
MKAYLLPAVLCLLLALLLAGCGSGAGPAAVTAPPASETAAAASAAPSEAPPSATLPDAGLKPAAGTEDDTAAEERLELAKSFVDRPLSELKEKFGEPLSATYASSCLGPGKDGELKYEGFTVITYQEGESETVSYVEANG